nr:hypothetical protein [Escherichia coli]
MDINKIPGLVLLIKAEFHISQHGDIKTLTGNFFPDCFQFILPEIKIVGHGDKGKLLLSK